MINDYGFRHFYSELSFSFIGLTYIHFNSFNFLLLPVFFYSILFQILIAPVKFCKSLRSRNKYCLKKVSVDRLRISNQ